MYALRGLLPRRRQAVSECQPLLRRVVTVGRAETSTALGSSPTAGDVPSSSVGWTVRSPLHLAGGSNFPRRNEWPRRLQILQEESKYSRALADLRPYSSSQVHRITDDSDLRENANTGASAGGSSSLGRVAVGPGSKPRAGESGGKGIRQQTRGGASSSSSPTLAGASSVQLSMSRFRRVVHRALESCQNKVRKAKSLMVAFARDPLIVKEWCVDIRDAVVHFCRWVATGFRLFGADVRASFYLTKRVVRGYPLTVRQRTLLVRTTSDCLKLIPFSFFIVVPFAELALPFVLRFFPGLLPSTFFERKYDNATLARKLKAKEEMAEFWQRVVLERTKEISEAEDSEFADKAAELQDFQEKLMEGREFPRLKEILRFSKLFQEEWSLGNMTQGQLRAMSKMLGLPQSNSWWPSHLEVQLRHHITNLRREDRDYLWEGIDGLTRKELIEACRKRAIRFHEVTEEEMRKDLTRWLELSANHRNIPTSLLLWIQSFYLRAPGSEGSESSERMELQMRVQREAKPVELGAKEAFHRMAERQKAHLQVAQQKLEVMRKEIDEVIDHPVETPNEGGDVAPEGGKRLTRADEKDMEREDDGSCGVTLEEKEEQRHQVLRHVHELDAALHLYKEVVERQKGLLDHQLHFLTSMRDSKLGEGKNADLILLDQRVRLMEMIGAFKKSTAEIEVLLGECRRDRQGSQPSPDGHTGPTSALGSVNDVSYTNSTEGH